jgi:hypothetical protein
MRRLIALLLVAGAVAGVVLFWRRNKQSWRSGWCSAGDSTCSWGKAATDEAGKAADTVAGGAERAGEAASTLADEPGRA